MATIDSDFRGRITQIILAFPAESMYEDTHFRDKNPYASAIEILNKFPSDIEYYFLTHSSVKEKIVKIIGDFGSSRNIQPPIVTDEHFTVWMEDPFEIVSSGGTTTLIQPDFYRYNEFYHKNVPTIIKSGISTISDVKTKPGFSFEGGNLHQDRNRIVYGKDIIDFSAENKLSDSKNKLDSTFAKSDSPIQILSSRSSPFRWETTDEKKVRDYLAKHDKEGSQPIIHEFFVNRAMSQPMYHLDLFITAIPDGSSDNLKLVIGEPVIGMKDYSTTDAIDITSHIDETASDTRKKVYRWLMNKQISLLETKINECVDDLTGRGYEILRTPMPLLYYDRDQPTIFGVPGGSSRASSPNVPRDVEIRKDIIRRHWYWGTYNNCIIDHNGSEKKVYLPNFAEGDWAEDLSDIETQISDFWASQDYTPVFISHMHPYAQRNGGLNCIVKVLSRSL